MLIVHVKLDMQDTKNIRIIFLLLSKLRKQENPDVKLYFYRKHRKFKMYEKNT